MCGIFGLASSYLSEHELEQLKPMVHLSSLRGVHSAGVSVISKKTHGNAKEFSAAVLKGAVLPAKLVYSDDLQTIYNKNKGRVTAVLGHNRHATLGEITSENAHPFRIGRIIGMHNGTVPDLVPKNSKTTDSQAIFTMLEKDGLTKTLEAIKHGAFCLVWADMEEQKVNIIRNHARPLHILQAGGTVYWMSEKRMLKIMQDSGVGVSSTVEELPTWTLAQISFGDHKVQQKHIGYPGTPPFTVTPPATGSSSTALIRPTMERNPTLQYGTSLKTYPYVMPSSRTRSEPAFIGPSGEAISLSEWLNHTGEGCFNCNRGINQDSTIYWCTETETFDDKPIWWCEDCSQPDLLKTWGVTRDTCIKGHIIKRGDETCN